MGFIWYTPRWCYNPILVHTFIRCLLFISESVISGLYLTGDITSDVFSKTCRPTVSNTIYSMPDFISAAGSGIEMAKSQCDGKMQNDFIMD